jgi:hypothetical protein
VPNVAEDTWAMLLVIENIAPAKNNIFFIQLVLDGYKELTRQKAGLVLKR